MSALVGVGLITLALAVALNAWLLYLNSPHAERRRTQRHRRRRIRRDLRR